MDLISQGQFLKLCFKRSQEANKALTRILKYMDILENLMLYTVLVEEQKLQQRDLRQDPNIVRLDHILKLHLKLDQLNLIRNLPLAKITSPDSMNPFLLPDMAQDLRLADFQLQIAPFHRPNLDRDQFSQPNQNNRKKSKFSKPSRNLMKTKLTESV